MGSYCNDTALTAPTGLCTAGYFCIVGSDNHAQEICTAGRYCPEGSHTPTRCPAGTFSNTTGLTAVEECTNCTKGSYCQSTGLTDVEGNCTQGYYCPEVFVGTVTQQILPTSANAFDIKYYFKLVTSFKGLINLVGSIVVVRVSSQGSLCGFRLTVGDTYLLSGFRNKKTKRISSSTCGNFHYKKGDITFQMMLYLFTIGQWSYKKNCSCKEIINPRFEPGTFDESKGCKLPAELNADLDCYDKTG